MRFDQIDIPAFGPFTDLSLSFPAGEQDAHVIFGANEAGKSSLLRAIHDLLFGIPGQTPDGFLHPYPKLRLQGTLVNKAGETLTIQRKKGNKGTLLDGEGKPLAAGELLPFLGPVDAEYFSRMFGLDGDELRKGAAELLDEEGAIAKALFSAGLGGLPVHQILTRLNEEAESLFRGRATAKVTLRPAVKEYKNLLKLSREAMVPPESWDMLEQELAECAARREACEATLLERAKQLEWLQRCEDALSFVGRLTTAELARAELADCPDLGSDFAEGARRAGEAVRAAEQRMAELAGPLSRLEEQLKIRVLDEAVLVQGAAIDEAHEYLAAYRTHKKQAADLDARRGVLEAELQVHMKSLDIAGDPSALDRYRMLATDRLACTEAAENLQHALAEQKAHQQQLALRVRRRDELEAELQGVPEAQVDAIRQALSSALSANDVYTQKAAAQLRVDALERATRDLHQQLHDVPRDLERAAALAVPIASTLRNFRDRLDEAERAVLQVGQQVEERSDRQKALESDWERLTQAVDLPSEASLDAAREKRDAGWVDITAKWEAGASPTNLIAQYPGWVADADAMADRLRHEADAVARRDEKKLQIVEGSAELKTLIRKQRAAAKEKAEVEQAWQAEWASSGVPARSPREMEEWREAWMAFRDARTTWVEAQHAFAADETLIQDAVASLRAVLTPEAEMDFPALQACAQQRVRAAEEAAGQRKEMLRQQASLTSQIELMEEEGKSLDAEGSEAQKAWEEVRVQVELPATLSAEKGLSLLEERRVLMDRFDAWQVAGEELAAVETQVEAYEQMVRALADSLEVQAESLEQREAGLWARISEARTVKVQRDQLTEQAEETRVALDEGRAAKERANALLDEQVSVAGLAALEDLDPLLLQLEKRAAIDATVRELENDLAGPARGVPVREFVARVQAEDSETLSTRKEQLLREQQEAQAALTPVLEQMAALRQEKERLEVAGDAAADYLQQAESVAAGIQQDAARFVRLRLATHFLGEQIEQYRKENQGPLLARSAELFAAITLGSFAGLEAEYNADDVPVLVGRRPDGSTVRVEGMSEGSRDQLFLALRLAALEHYIGEHEPMPLILDDLLMTFDDERARAILGELAKISQGTQVLLFTHHTHLVDLCREVPGFQVTELPTNS